MNYVLLKFQIIWCVCVSELCVVGSFRLFGMYASLNYVRLENYSATIGYDLVCFAQFFLLQA
jgi:hypothetical protein